MPQNITSSYLLRSLNLSLDNAIVVVVPGATLDADTAVFDVAVGDDAPGVAWLFDAIGAFVVAAVFSPAQWNEADARAWFAAATTPGSERTMPAMFAVAPAPSTEPKPYVDVATGFVWKMILRAGRVYDPSGKPLDVEPHVLTGLVESFGHAVQYVDIPLGHHPERYGDVPELNTGFVRALDIRADGTELWGALDFTDSVIKTKVLDGSIADVSAWIEANFHDPNHAGVVWAYVLWHVCLTNKPQMTRLYAFTHNPTLRLTSYSATEPTSSVPLQSHQGAMLMALKVGSAVKTKDGAIAFIVELVTGKCYRLKDANGVDLNLVPESELIEFDGVFDPAKETDETPAPPATFSAVPTADRDRALSQWFGITSADVTQLKGTARTLEIQTITNALQGIGTHPAVSLPAGARVAPVVVEAVTVALKDAPESLRLSTTPNGTKTFDALLLSVVNAVAASLSIPPQPTIAPAPAALSASAPPAQTDIAALAADVKTRI